MAKKWNDAISKTIDTICMQAIEQAIAQTKKGQKIDVKQKLGTLKGIINNEINTLRSMLESGDHLTIDAKLLKELKNLNSVLEKTQKSISPILSEKASKDKFDPIANPYLDCESDKRYNTIAKQLSALYKLDIIKREVFDEFIKAHFSYLKQPDTMLSKKIKVEEKYKDDITSLFRKVYADNKELFKRGGLGIKLAQIMSSAFSCYTSSRIEIGILYSRMGNKNLTESKKIETWWNEQRF